MHCRLATVLVKRFCTAPSCGTLGVHLLHRAVQCLDGSVGRLAPARIFRLATVVSIFTALVVSDRCRAVRPSASRYLLAAIGDGDVLGSEQRQGVVGLVDAGSHAGAGGVDRATIAVHVSPIVNLTSIPFRPPKCLQPTLAWCTSRQAQYGQGRQPLFSLTSLPSVEVSTRRPLSFLACNAGQSRYPSQQRPHRC